MRELRGSCAQCTNDVVILGEKGILEMARKASGLNRPNAMVECITGVTKDGGGVEVNSPTEVIQFLNNSSAVELCSITCMGEWVKTLTAARAVAGKMGVDDEGIEF